MNLLLIAFLFVEFNADVFWWAAMGLVFLFKLFQEIYK